MKSRRNTEFVLFRLYASAAMFVGAAVILTAISLDARALVSQAGSQSESQTAGLGAAAADHSSTHPELPPGEGRDVVIRVCAKCHSPNIILAYGQNRVGWENAITKMARLGAKGTDEDYSDIADYLTANFPPSAVQKVFVNMASETQLSAILDISVDDAKAIIAYRDKIKGFKSIEDMKSVPNADAKKIDAKKDHLVF